MNERIKQLADQAGWIYVGNSRVPNMEKFAELIVRESARIADMVSENKVECVGDNIMVYFGIEE